MLKSLLTTPAAAMHTTDHPGELDGLGHVLCWPAAQLDVQAWALSQPHVAHTLRHLPSLAHASSSPVQCSAACLSLGRP